MRGVRGLNSRDGAGKKEKDWLLEFGWNYVDPSPEVNSKEKAVIMGRLSSRSQSNDNAQRAETHRDSTVVEDILRTDHDTVSYTSVLPSRQLNDMAATQPSANTPRIVSESEEWTVDGVMIREDISDGCNQLYDTSDTQCGLIGFHHINPHSLKLFSPMSLHVTFREQPVTPNRKCGKLRRGPTACTTGTSGAAAGEATRKEVTSWCQKHSGYAVIIGSSG